MALVRYAMPVKNRAQTNILFYKILFFCTLAVVVYSQFEILYTVIGFVTIFVVYSLVLGKWTLNVFSHNKSVLKNTTTNSLSLHHWLSQFLIFFRESRNPEDDVSSASNSSSVPLFVARIRDWWMITVLGTTYTKSSIWSFVSNLCPNGLRIYVSPLSTITTCYSDAQTPSKGFAVIPVYGTVIHKLNVRGVNCLKSFLWHGCLLLSRVLYYNTKRRK